MEICLLIAFILKHTLADYYLQFSWMIKEKSIYGAWGGIAHSGLHGFLTFIVLFTLYPWLAILFAILDGILHYHIDYVKSNLWKSKNLTSSDHMYWAIHGTDQALHFVTYALIIALLPF